MSRFITVFIITLTLNFLFYISASENVSDRKKRAGIIEKPQQPRSSNQLGGYKSLTDHDKELTKIHNGFLSLDQKERVTKSTENEAVRHSITNEDDETEDDEILFSVKEKFENDTLLNGTLHIKTRTSKLQSVQKPQRIKRDLRNPSVANGVPVSQISANTGSVCHECEKDAGAELEFEEVYEDGSSLNGTYKNGSLTLSKLRRPRRDVSSQQLLETEIEVDDDVNDDNVTFSFTETFSNGTVINGTLDKNNKIYTNVSAEEKRRQRRSAESKIEDRSGVERYKNHTLNSAVNSFVQAFSGLSKTRETNQSTTETRPRERRNAAKKKNGEPKSIGHSILYKPKLKIPKRIAIGGVFWEDVWKSKNVKWVGKIVNSKRVRPSDRQFFHQLLPDVMQHFNNTCIGFAERDERDYMLLKNIQWKDPQPSLKYPSVPKQCAFGRSSGFLCMVLNDAKSCYYTSGWAQDRVQAVVDGRHSDCGQRRRLQMMTHALGLMHEHDRGDAYKHVHIHPRLRVLAQHDDQLNYRIPQDNCDVFRQNSSDLPFDFSSIVLHDDGFRPDSNQMDYDLPLFPKRLDDIRKQISHRKPGLSHFDQLKLRILYGCHNKMCLARKPCQNFGFRGRKCTCACAPGFSGEYCQKKDKRNPDPCTQTYKKPISFRLNQTDCHAANQSYNYTVGLSTKKDHRFVISISMKTVRTLLHGLRILPDCQHARIYFTGSGNAQPQTICGETLLKDPLKLTSRDSSAVLAIVLKLPLPPTGEISLKEALPSSQNAIGDVELDIRIEKNPSRELTVNITRPATTTHPTSPTTSPPETEPTPSTPPPPPPTPQPPNVNLPVAAPPDKPEKKTTTSKPTNTNMVKMLQGETALASRSGGKGSGGAAAAIVVVLLIVVGVTGALGVYMWMHRHSETESLDGEPGEGEDVLPEEDEVQYANSGTQAVVAE